MAMPDLALKTIAHDSPEYRAAVALRSAILRRPLGLEFSAEELAAEATSHHVGCFLEGRLVGCLVLEPVDVEEIRMRQVAVDEKARGRGVGRRMVEFAEDLARNLGFLRMVAHARESAVPFYERLGYAGVGERFTEVTIPHRTMVKAL